MIFWGNYFWNLETPVFIFYVFITEIYLTNIWHDNWCSVFDVVKWLRLHCFWKSIGFCTQNSRAISNRPSPILDFLILMLNTISLVIVGLKIPILPPKSYSLILYNIRLKYMFLILFCPFSHYAQLADQYLL